MKKIFIRPMWHYDSYTDFWRLVELSGYPVVMIDNLKTFEADTDYIVSPMNGEWKPFIEASGVLKRSVGVPYKFIHWNLERPNAGVSSYKDSNDKLLDEGYVDEHWVSDRALAEDTGYRFMPMGSHAGLGKPGTINDKMYDCIHLACYSNRRSWLFREPSRIKQHLANGVSVADNGWGDERDAGLRKSKFMLNVHQDDTEYIEPLRFALAAAYGLPIITELCKNAYPYTSYMIEQFTVSGLVARVASMAQHYDLDTYKWGLSFREQFTTLLSFRNCVEAAK